MTTPGRAERKPPAIRVGRPRRGAAACASALGRTWVVVAFSRVDHGGPADSRMGQTNRRAGHTEDAAVWVSGRAVYPRRDRSQDSGGLMTSLSGVRIGAGCHGRLAECTEQDPGEHLDGLVD